MRKHKCSVCGYVYDDAAGIPDKNITAGTKWEALSSDFMCPVCTAAKSAFLLLNSVTSEPVSVLKKKRHGVKGTGKHPSSVNTPSLGEQSMGALKTRHGELSTGEIAAICSNLAKACEKQRLTDEKDAFTRLAEYYKNKTSSKPGMTLNDVAGLLEADISKAFAFARNTAKAEADRGALRSLAWSEKVSLMQKSLLERFVQEGAAMLEEKRIFVCDICGFIHIGEAPPDTCPVCKVQKHKILEMER
jgi:rubredoxin